MCVPPLGLLYVATEMGNAKTLVWIYQCFVGMMLFYWVVLPIEIAFFLQSVAMEHDTVTVEGEQLAFWRIRAELSTGEVSVS